MNQTNILIVDDEKEIGSLIRSYLEKENYNVHYAANGEKSLEILNTEAIDLILLDIMLPDKSGVDLCLDIRKETNCPIIFLSCKSEEIDKIIALSVGGDDYIEKPFLAGELTARIKAHLRRNNILHQQEKSSEDVIKYPGILLNTSTREVFINQTQVKLTAKEFDILYLLAKNPKRVFSIEQLFQQVWKSDHMESDTNTIMVYISNLRRKIETTQKYIVNVRGVGYKFVSNYKKSE